MRAASLWIICLVVAAAGACRHTETEHTTEVSPDLTPCQGPAFDDDVCIAGSEFMMGHDGDLRGESNCDDSGSCAPPPVWRQNGPAHRVRVDPFFIDRYPASNAEYLECVEVGMCTDERNVAVDNRFNIHDPRIADYPVAVLYPDQAADYCRWKGKRLPTEAEWERAARGPEGFDYPWGNEPPDCRHYPCGSPPIPEWHHTYFAKVGSPSLDVSAEGVHGMVTSAPELVQDGMGWTFYLRSPVDNPVNLQERELGFVIRGNINHNGGSPIYEYNGTDRILPAWFRDEFIGGVRCARDDDGATQQAATANRAWRRILLRRVRTARRRRP